MASYHLYLLPVGKDGPRNGVPEFGQQDFHLDFLGRVGKVGEGSSEGLWRAQSNKHMVIVEVGKGKE